MTAPRPTERIDRRASAPQIADEILIDDLATLRQLANPIRLRVLFYLREPRSVAELAEAMDVPVTRLYYHVNILDDAGVIVVVDVRKRGAQLEKVYRIVAEAIRPAPSILADGADPVEFAEVAASLVLDSARAELVSSLARHAERGFDPSAIHGSLGRTIARVPKERATEFIERIETLIREIKDEEDADDASLYGFTYTFFPIDPPSPAEHIHAQDDETS